MQPIFINLITKAVLTEQVDSSAEARGREVPFFFFCRRTDLIFIAKDGPPKTA